jgi:hypothetical protein
VQQGDVHGRLDLVGHLVHGVRAQHEEICPGGLQPTGGVGEELTGL